MAKHNDATLAAAVELARSGTSTAFIMEMLQKFGPTMLQFLVDVLNHSKTKKLAMADVPGDIIPGQVVIGDVVNGVDTSFIDIIIQKYLPLLVQKYLPLILEKYGPVLVQMLLDYVKNNPQFIEPLIKLILGGLGKSQ